MKQNGYRGLSWSLLRIFLKQLLDSLHVLYNAKIIHCDLKPENILRKKKREGEEEAGSVWSERKDERSSHLEFFSFF